MKKITYFYIRSCPYCIHADRAIEELKREDPAYREIEIERICEEENPDVIAGYDYYYVPCMFIGSRKIYEAHPLQRYDDIKASVKRVFDAAVNDGISN
ncbi:MAG: glutaredoxin [Eubacterium sp.]|nr:glutaredoxin [Eubacterium sp.]